MCRSVNGHESEVDRLKQDRWFSLQNKLLTCILICKLVLDDMTRLIREKAKIRKVCAFLEISRDFYRLSFFEISDCILYEKYEKTKNTLHHFFYLNRILSLAHQNGNEVTKIECNIANKTL